ncbi:MAG: nucleotide exchange factor GrpE [Acidobacteria bacterium]|nr:MAG: nucleotide exchange factor GrpE [Acidobacteriota bacterium]
MPDDAMNEQDSTGAATEPREPEAQDSAESPLDALRKEKDALHDRLLRTAAEFDNYRKRVDRDRRDQVDAATADAVVDFLPIVDDLERALKAPTGGDSEGFRKGVELIHQQMVDLLRKRGVRPIEAVGAEFDPRYHQAVAQEASADHREGEVMEEYARGYMLGDRLLRPAMVKVAKA